MRSLAFSLFPRVALCKAGFLFVCLFYSKVLTSKSWERESNNEQKLNVEVLCESN